MRKEERNKGFKQRGRLLSDSLEFLLCYICRGYSKLCFIKAKYITVYGRMTEYSKKHSCSGGRTTSAAEESPREPHLYIRTNHVRIQSTNYFRSRLNQEAGASTDADPPERRMVAPGGLRIGVLVVAVFAAPPRSGLATRPSPNVKLVLVGVLTA